MRVLVCVKRVPAPGARISLTDDAQSIDARNLGFTTSPHEECAVEAAVQIATETNGSSTVLTMGPVEAEEQLRYAISVGVDSALLIQTDGADVDPQATARGIIAAITHLEQRDGPFDLILFGNESADAGGYQVGVRVASALDRPIVSGIKNIEIHERSVVAHREIANGFEVYELPMPAALAVREGLNLPRYPTLPGRLKSRKAEVEMFDTTPERGGQQKTRLEAPPEKPSETVVLGHGVEAVPAIIEVLERLEIV